MTPSTNLGKAQADMIVDGCSDFGQKIITPRFEKDEVKKVNRYPRHNLFVTNFPSRKSVFQIFCFPKNLLLDWRIADRNKTL